MHRLAAALVGAALAVAIALVATRTGDAEIEGTTFTSTTDNVRVTLPKGWRASDQPSYPGVILRINRTRPRGTILLAVDPWPAPIDPECKNRPTTTEGATPQVYPPEMQVACVQQKRLAALGFDVTPIKEATRPWFDYQSTGHALRQGIAVLGHAIFTLVLATDTAGSRAQHARTFDSMLRSIRLLEEPSASGDGGAPATQPTASDGGAPATQPSPPDAGAGSASGSATGTGSAAPPPS